ncbi:MAG: hypothetical protein V4719_17970, partial [Planctomycetota bacterium]
MHQKVSVFPASTSNSAVYVAGVKNSIVYMNDAGAWCEMFVVLGSGVQISKLARNQAVKSN